VAVVTSGRLSLCGCRVQYRVVLIMMSDTNADLDDADVKHFYKLRFEVLTVLMINIEIF